MARNLSPAFQCHMQKGFCGCIKYMVSQTWNMCKHWHNYECRILCVRCWVTMYMTSACISNKESILPEYLIHPYLSITCVDAWCECMRNLCFIMKSLLIQRDRWFNPTASATTPIALYTSMTILVIAYYYSSWAQLFTYHEPFLEVGGGSWLSNY